MPELQVPQRAQLQVSLSGLPERRRARLQALPVQALLLGRNSGLVSGLP